MVSRDQPGLSEEVATRLLAERGPHPAPPSSRSYASIVRANVLTVFNAILLAFGAVTLVYGDWRDALFLGIVLANAAIGIVQEVRAKRALDRLAALVAPVATVVRDGRERRVGVGEVVVGDLLRVAPGDQVVADGTLEACEGLNLDESILSGESRPVAREAGDEVRSGSFVVEGVATFTVTAVGPDSYAERIAGEARSFRHPRSPLERALNRLLLTLVAFMVPLAAILGVSLWQRKPGVSETVATAVAAVVSLIPEGLILLASLTYAVAALRMARRGALAQQLNATESLASVDVICLDKTGTLTDPALRVLEVVPAPGVEPVALGGALGRFAASSPTRNATLDAVAAAHPEPVAAPGDTVPFASRRRWSALRLEGAWAVLGAPELFALGPLAARAATEAGAGRRVLAFGSTAADLRGPGGDPALPGDLPARGLVILAEALRADARETVAYLLAEGVELKVLSGDAPDTVAAIAADVGIPSSGPPLDGRELPEDAAALTELALRAAVVGRISPEGKRRVVEALRDAGRYVAMVGDGVNDVPALKAARLAIAQGSGAQMAKSVADVVLVRGDFAAVPPMVAEGRQVLRNVQRVANLFVTKSVFAAVLILTIGTSATAYPLLPRHLSLAASLTIGIPAFFLALAPSSGPWRTTGFLRAVASFAIPAGAAAGLGVVSGYLFALHALDLPTIEARTVATSTLILVGLYLVLALEAPGRRRRIAVLGLCAAMAAAYVVVLVLPSVRGFFALAAADPGIVLTAIVAAAFPVAALEMMGLRADRIQPGSAQPPRTG